METQVSPHHCISWDQTINTNQPSGLLDKYSNPTIVTKPSHVSDLGEYHAIWALTVSVIALRSMETLRTQKLAASRIWWQHIDKHSRKLDWEGRLYSPLCWNNSRLTLQLAQQVANTSTKSYSCSQMEPSTTCHKPSKSWLTFPICHALSLLLALVMQISRQWKNSMEMADF